MLTLDIAIMGFFGFVIGANLHSRPSHAAIFAILFAVRTWTLNQRYQPRKGGGK